jgi:hypothetical protein
VIFVTRVDQVGRDQATLCADLLFPIKHVPCIRTFAQGKFMIQSTRFFAALAFLACIFLAACGGSSTAMTGTTAAPTGTGSASSTVTSTSTGSAYSISGVVSGISDVSVMLSGASSNKSSTDAGGNFRFAKLAPGNYTISPSKTGYVLSPVSLAETITSASLTDANFAATASTAATYTISGTVNGSVAAGVIVTLNGTNVGSAITDLSGNYTFAGLVSGTYTVSASLDGYSFTSPLIVSLDNVDSVSNNFTSAATAAGGSLAFIQVSPLPEATVGAAYSSSIVEGISGGTAPYHYQTDTLATGTPPQGMIVNPNGNLTGTPTVSGQYNFSVCATDSAGEKSPCEATSITVVAAPSAQPTPSPTATLAANPSKIVSGATSELTWSSKNATACTAGGGWAGNKATSGKASIAPNSTTTVTLTCTGPAGSTHATAVITVTAASTPPTPAVTLTATSATIPSGSTSTLKWSSKNVTSCARSGGWSGAEAANGSLVVAPMSTTTYVLACTNSAGTAQSATKITVNSAAPPPAPTATLRAGAASITSGGSTTLTWSSTNASSCTASGGWTGTEAASGTKSVSPTATTTYTLGCTGSGGKAQVSATVTVNGSGPPPATSWVYYNGLFDWPGDYSFVAKADYHDKKGAPLSGKEDIKITLQGAYGGWLPYAQNWSFNSAPYTKLTFALKPTVANQQWSVYFVKVGDIPVGISVDVTQYGPAPVVGQWNTYTVPLAHLGVLGTTIYKFAIQDKTGMSNNTWYVDNVGFEP